MSQGFTSQVRSLGFNGLLGSSVILPNARFFNVFSGALGSGDHDLYTIPAGKRALLCQLKLYQGAGANSYYGQIKISGSYYQLSLLTSISANTADENSGGLYVGEAGESLSIHVSNAGLNVWFGIVEFDNSGPLKSSKLTSLSAGQNVLYSVPVGKSALVFPVLLTNTDSSDVNFTANIWNGSGGDRTYNYYIVPQGRVADTTTIAGTPDTVFTGDVITAFTASFLVSGDSFIVTADSGTAPQSAYLTVLEI